VRINLQEQERKVLLSNIDKLVNSCTDNLIVECLYSLAVQLSPKNSPELDKYTKFLSDIRAVSGQEIAPMNIGDHCIFKATSGYFYFKFKDQGFGKSAKITHAELKSQFNFTWNRSIGTWQKKQTNLGFNLDFFNEAMIRTSRQDFAIFKSNNL